MQLEIYVTIYTLIYINRNNYGTNVTEEPLLQFKAVHSFSWVTEGTGWFCHIVSVLSVLISKWETLQCMDCLNYKRAVSGKVIPWLFLLVYVNYRPIRIITESRQHVVPTVKLGNILLGKSVYSGNLLSIDKTYHVVDKLGVTDITWNQTKICTGTLQGLTLLACSWVDDALVWRCFLRISWVQTVIYDIMT